MKRSTEKEMMDLPGNPKALLVEDLRNLRTINRYLGGYRGVIKGLKQLVGGDRMKRFSLLDVGTGSADIPKVIVQWARNQDIEARVVALDPDPSRWGFRDQHDINRRQQGSTCQEASAFIRDLARQRSERMA